MRTRAQSSADVSSRTFSFYAARCERLDDDRGNDQVVERLKRHRRFLEQRREIHARVPHGGDEALQRHCFARVEERFGPWSFVVRGSWFVVRGSWFEVRGS